MRVEAGVVNSHHAFDGALHALRNNEKVVHRPVACRSLWRDDNTIDNPKPSGRL